MIKYFLIALVVVWPDQPQNIRLYEEVIEPPPTEERTLGKDYEIDDCGPGCFIIEFEHLNAGDTIRVQQ